METDEIQKENKIETVGDSPSTRNKTIEDFLEKDIFNVETNDIGRDHEGKTIIEKRLYKYVLLQTHKWDDYETWGAYEIKGNSLDKVLHMQIQGSVDTYLEVDIFQDSINMPFICLELILERCRNKIQEYKNKI